jgi:large subunit ribosomal protein L15
MTALHEIRRPKTLKRPYRRVGRGQSSTRGKQSGRGGKGQTARSGHKIRPALRDIIKKIPKRRGFGKNRGRTVWEMKPRPISITLASLESAFNAGVEITPALLVERGMIRGRPGQGKNGRAPQVKVVGHEVSKKLTIKGVLASAGAKAALEKAGGTIS